jgi:hypothetical protein
VYVRVDVKIAVCRDGEFEAFWSIVAIGLHVVSTDSSTATCTDLGAKRSNSAFTDSMLSIARLEAN